MKRLNLTILLSLAVVTVAGSVQAQENIIVEARKPMPVATGNNLYCAGYIQTSAISTANKIVGAQDEADKYNFSDHDFLYINMGRDKGVRVGDKFSVVRPRGSVKSEWSHKGNLGSYVQEVGVLQVVNVKDSVAVAKVASSCDTMYLGDLVQVAQERVSPVSERRPQLNRFADPSGKAQGRIIMSRDSAETLTRDFIAYVDLGTDDHVKVGDHLTIFRALQNGNLTMDPEREMISSRDYGFQSEAYAGGKFSNQSPRKSGDHGNGKEVTTEKSKEGRSNHLRKVVGEAVVLNVKEKTATVVITRTGQEIHPGDWVEIQ